MKRCSPSSASGSGVEGAPEQTDAQNVVSGAVAVLAVVQESGAVARFGEVGEAVGADLEAHLVPGGVAVGRAPGCAVHSLEGRLVGAYVRAWEERPQQDLPLVPVHARLDVQAPRGRRAACRSGRSWTPESAARRGPRRAGARLPRPPHWRLRGPPPLHLVVLVMSQASQLGGLSAYAQSWFPAPSSTSRSASLS